MSATFLTIKKRFQNRGLPAQAGFTLVETIFYLFVLTLVTGVIVQMLMSIGGIYRNIKLTRELESSATIAMESMLREVRAASSVVLAGSTLVTSPGTLKLAGIDEDGDPYDIVFNTSGGVIQISKNGSTPVALTSSSGSVSFLSFTRLTNATSEGVRVELEMSGSTGSIGKSERFYGFSVLRGSY